MPYKTNDFQSDLSISELFANFMDKAFYRTGLGKGASNAGH